jgi:hypothetical protein
MPSRGFWGSRLWLGAALAGGAVGLGGLSGCPFPGSNSAQQATTFSGGKRPELVCAREGAERVDVGSWRGTGRPDVARVYKRDGGFRSPSVLSCREVDMNGDGRKDMLVYYEPDGRKLREEFDHDYDGVVDVKGFYEQGKLVRQELDVNHDGKADVVQHFEAGKMVRSERVLSEPEPDKSAATDKSPTTTDKPAIDKPAAPLDRPTAPAASSGTGSAGTAMPEPLPSPPR